VTDLFEPLDDSPAYRRVANAIETKIVARQLRTGDALPSETDLARQFGVNRSTVREAIRELETQGLLGRVRGAKRLRVTRPAAARISSDVSRALALHDVGFLELWEAMMVIEPAAAEFAAGRRTARDLDAIASAADRFAQGSRETEQNVRAVIDFFRSVADASGNRVLAISQATLNLLLAPALTRVIDRVPQARDRIRAAQKSILTAIKSRRREDARKWMEKHIRDFKRGYEVGGIPLDAIPLDGIALTAATINVATAKSKRTE
jgi:GntR family transcriptional regulator, transcriptional repressor for pyruvate dehydrogenase complex